MANSGSALERIIQPQDGSFSVELADYVLRLDFPPQDHARYVELSNKAREGALSEGEKAQLEDLLTANDVLAILQSKARTSLRQRNPAA